MFSVQAEDEDEEADDAGNDSDGESKTEAGEDKEDGHVGFSSTQYLSL